MNQKSRAFWGGALLILAAVLMVAKKGSVNILPIVTYEKVQFVLLDESSEPDVEVAKLVNSSQWQELSSRGVTAVRYDVTPTEKQPALDKYLKDNSVFKGSTLKLNYKSEDLTDLEWLGTGTAPTYTPMALKVYTDPSLS